MQEVYNFARDHELREAVIPLQIDSESGIGLYVLGEEYLPDLGMEHRVSKSTAGKDCGNSGRKPLLFTQLFIFKISAYLKKNSIYMGNRIH